MATIDRGVGRAGTRAPQKRRGSIRSGQSASGYLFIAPGILAILVFVAIPVLMALWVSVSDWGGRGSPFTGGVHFVGARNYVSVTSGGGLAESDFGTSLRNNLWYVVLVVPLQTILALALASFVNTRVLRGRGFFRTAFYFPSVTSSVAITVLWFFLFNPVGAINQLLHAVGLPGPNWPNDATGVLHNALGALGVHQGPALLTGHGFLEVSWWDWLAGPSVGMLILISMAVFTTSGTFMLLFLAALANLSSEVQEAAMVDGASGWQRFRLVTVPQLRPTLFTVLTLGLIGAWQVFDQVLVGSKGGPAKTTITPAYLSYTDAFANNAWGEASAIAFILFAIIVVLTLLQRYVMRERRVTARRMRRSGFTAGPDGGWVVLSPTTGRLVVPEASGEER